jgi:hypothetical protein
VRACRVALVSCAYCACIFFAYCARLRHHDCLLHMPGYVCSMDTACMVNMPFKAQDEQEDSKQWKQVEKTGTGVQPRNCSFPRRPSKTGVVR